MVQLPGFLETLTRRWLNLSLRVRGLAVLALPVIALLVSVALVSRLEREKADAEQRVKHSLEVRAQLEGTYIVLMSAESEVRNYALNGLEEGLWSFDITSAAIDPQFAKIAELIRDNREQAARLEKLKVLVHSRFEGLKKLRAYYGSPETRSKPAPAELRARARISPDVILAANELGVAEVKLFQEATKGNAERQTKLRIWIFVSVSVGLLGGILGVVLFTRGIKRRIERLERNASRLVEGLPSESAGSSSDELGRLATAIEKTGAAIASRSQELKLALEGGGVLIWELEPGSGRIRYHAGSEASQSAAFPAELLPETANEWIAMVHSDDREHIEQELTRIASESGSFQIEYRVVVRGGGIHWMTVRAQSYGSGIHERRLLGVIADITARKAASQEIERQARELIDSREALQRQTRILQSILDSMGDGVVVADTRGKFLVFNPAARQILGARSFGDDVDQWPKQHGLFLPDMVTLYPPDELPFVRSIRGDAVDAAEIFVRPAGTSEGTWVSVNARPLQQDDGEIQGGVIVIRDITAQKHAAEALQLAKQDAEMANHAKSEFLSRMSHELRTPLNSILGFAQLLELEKLNEQANDNIYHILKGGYHLLDLINEILDLARIESGRITLSSEPVGVREALKDAIDLVGPLAVEKHVNLRPDIALRCNCHVHADRQRLKQVLLNLLSNAIKFNRSGGSVELSCEESSPGRLRIYVIDTGSGISPQGLKRIFTPFERLEADGTDAGGTGLGLALSKRLIEAMGGTIGVESALGFGSKFYIELATIEDPAKVLESEPSAIALMDAEKQPRRGTVLYVEDNPSNLRLIERIFAHRPGVRLLSAMQGHLGLDLADLHTPDWILLDLHLPDISGEEVLRRLRANPRTQQIPITILSADATAGQISRLLEAGARDYLTKPLDVRRFIDLLETTIPSSELSAQEQQGVYAERNHSEKSHSNR
jgi:signal transduction histidine kinase/FixJ family two-component response regulator/CHASE3 domain sensor protein